MSNLLDWIQTTSGLLVAVTALLVSVASLKVAFLTRATSGVRRTRWPTILAIVISSLGAVPFLVRSVIPSSSPVDTKGPERAWKAYNAADWKTSIQLADDCITTYRKTASQIQALLESRRAPTPPTGRLTEAREEVLRNGVLNDVATCAFIKGSAAERLGLRDLAEEAYNLAASYTYARTWDPNGWFWSPAEIAMERLRSLSERVLVTIKAPASGEQVQAREDIQGSVKDPNSTVWIVVHPSGTDQFWVQQPAIPKRDGSWSTSVYFGGPTDAGKQFEVRALTGVSPKLRAGEVLVSWPSAQSVSAVLNVTRH